MALRSTLQRCMTPLRTSVATAVAPRAPLLSSTLGAGGARFGLLQNPTYRTMMTGAFRPQVRAAGASWQALSRDAALAGGSTQKQTAVGSTRPMSSWRLRPYAAAGTAAMLPLSTLSSGFSKVSLSLLVLPWKALPTALCIAPVAAVLPAMYRMIFQNSMRHTTASVFTMILYLVLSFMPVPCFENLFSDLFFYGVALVSTFFMYTFFPEVLLHDFMFMHYLALFTIPLIPLAFAYMPMFAARSYLFL